MKLLKDIESIALLDKEVVLTFGNFDGVHLGHRFFLNSLIKEASESRSALVVATFVPHPREVIVGQKNFLINTYEERKEILKSIGVQYLLEINFSKDISELAPSDFLDLFLKTKKVKKIVVGHDFAFGKLKSGNFEFIKNYCEPKNIRCEEEIPYYPDGSHVSSTHIRELLKDGLVNDVESLLGRCFFMRGPVVHGASRGHRHGIRTANIEVGEGRIIPREGVYICKTDILDKTFLSLTNIGRNPTFVDKGGIVIENHILDFEGDLYSKSIQINFHRFLRDEMKFLNSDELVEQIQKDIVKTREFFQ